MSETTAPADPVKSRRSWKSFVLIVTCTGIVVSVPVFVVGYALGYVPARGERGDRDVRVVSELIAKNGDQYSALTIDRGPLDKFRLRGTVPTQEALDHLNSEMIRSLGEYRAEDIMEVYVSDKDGG